MCRERGSKINIYIEEVYTYIRSLVLVLLLEPNVVDLCVALGSLFAFSLLLLEHIFHRNFFRAK